MKSPPIIHGLKYVLADRWYINGKFYESAYDYMRGKGLIMAQENEGAVLSETGRPLTMEMLAENVETVDSIAKVVRLQPTRKDAADHSKMWNGDPRGSMVLELTNPDYFDGLFEKGQEYEITIRLKPKPVVDERLKNNT